MASPDPAGWTAMNGGFTHQDREFYCSTSGQPARSGEPIFRGSFIDMEGFYSICLDSALQLGKLAGLVDPGVSDAAVARQIKLEDELEAALVHVGALQDVIDAYEVLDGIEGA